MVRNKFFNSSVNTQAERKIVINFGGTGDCGFRSVAGSLLFHFSKDNNSLNDKIISVMMQKFYHHFPDYAPQTHIDPKRHLKALLMHQKIESLVVMFAYVLRQIAVDYMCANPEEFRGAFVDTHENTNPEKMRQQNTWIDESAIAALAKSLDLGIKVTHKQSNKKLPASYIYNESNHGLQVEIALENNHYQALVTATEAEVDKFKGIRTVYSAESCVAANIEHQDDDMDAILQSIKAYDEKVLREFNALKESLAFKVKLNELNKDKLVKMYIKGLSTSDYLQGRHIASLKESGNSAFFNTIVEAQKANAKGLTITNSNNDQSQDTVVDELIHAIARACVIDQVNITELFEHIEQENYVTKQISGNTGKNLQEVSESLTTSLSI